MARRRCRALTGLGLGLGLGLPALVVFTGVGCGPIQYFGQVSGGAAAALAAAERVDAARFAPFEMVKARAYFDKSREEAAQSSFEVAIGYGRRAEELAWRARTVAQERAARADRPGSRVIRPPAPTSPPPAAPREAPSLPDETPEAPSLPGAPPAAGPGGPRGGRL